MASYPGSKVHRVSRRKLGRGQFVQMPPVNVYVTSATDTATLTFSAPVVLSGTPNLNISGGITEISSDQLNALTATITCSGTLSGATYSLEGADPSIKTFQGGPNNAATGTFS